MKIDIRLPGGMEIKIQREPLSEDGQNNLMMLAFFVFAIGAFALAVIFG